MVEDVEELGAELEAEALGEVRIADCREIQLGEAGADQRVARDIAVGAGRGWKEGRRIEVLGSACAGRVLPVKLGFKFGRTGLRVSPVPVGL